MVSRSNLDGLNWYLRAGKKEPQLSARALDGCTRRGNGRTRGGYAPPAARARQGLAAGRWSNPQPPFQPRTHSSLGWRSRRRRGWTEGERAGAAPSCFPRRGGHLQLEDGQVGFDVVLLFFALHAAQGSRGREGIRGLCAAHTARGPLPRAGPAYHHQARQHSRGLADPFSLLSIRTQGRRVCSDQEREGLPSSSSRPSTYPGCRGCTSAPSRCVEQRARCGARVSGDSLGRTATRPQERRRSWPLHHAPWASLHAVLAGQHPPAKHAAFGGAGHSRTNTHTQTPSAGARHGGPSAAGEQGRAQEPVAGAAQAKGRP